MGKFHLARAFFWPLFGAFVFLFAPSLASSVALIFVLSLYANFSGDLGAWQANRAKKEAESD